MAHILDELRRTVVLDDLSARPAGDAAADPARSRKELSTHIIRRMSRHAYNPRMSMRQAIVVSVLLAGSRVVGAAVCASRAAPAVLPRRVEADRAAGKRAGGFRARRGGDARGSHQLPSLELRLYDPNAKKHSGVSEAAADRIDRARLGRTVVHSAGWLQPEPAAGQRSRRASAPIRRTCGPACARRRSRRRCATRTTTSISPGLRASAG